MLRAAIPTAVLPVPRDASFCPGLPGGLRQSWDRQERDADSGLRLPKLLRWAGKAFGEELNQHSPARAPPGELLGLNFLPNPKFIHARMLLTVGWAHWSRGTPRIHTRDPPGAEPSVAKPSQTVKGEGVFTLVFFLRKKKKRKSSAGREAVSVVIPPADLSALSLSLSIYIFAFVYFYIGNFKHLYFNNL